MCIVKQRRIAYKMVGGNHSMTTSRQHQNAHGIGQIEEQLNNQSEAAAEIQGQNKIDQEIKEAANRPITKSDEITE